MNILKPIRSSVFSHFDYWIAGKKQGLLHKQPTKPYLLAVCILFIGDLFTYEDFQGISE